MVTSSTSIHTIWRHNHDKDSLSGRWPLRQAAKRGTCSLSDIPRARAPPCSQMCSCNFRLLASVSLVQLLSRVWFCDPIDCNTPGFPVQHQLLEHAQTHVHWVGDAIQPFHPLLSPSPPAFNLSQLQSLFKWVSSSHQQASVLEYQLQHQSFQWIFRTDFL